jgi:hypothetical protein
MIISIALMIYGAAALNSSNSQSLENVVPVTTDVVSASVAPHQDQSAAGAENGFFYERDVVLKWIAAHHTCSVTRQLINDEVHPNQSLKQLIADRIPLQVRQLSALAKLYPDKIIRLIHQEFSKNAVFIRVSTWQPISKKDFSYA